MTPHGWLLVSWVLSGAAVLVAHLVVVVSVFNAKSLPWKHRWWALVPVAAPVLAWLDGRRASPVIWALLVLTYLVLRALEGI